MTSTTFGIRRIEGETETISFTEIDDSIGFNWDPDNHATPLAISGIRPGLYEIGANGKPILVVSTNLTEYQAGCWSVRRTFPLAKDHFAKHWP